MTRLIIIVVALYLLYRLLKSLIAGKPDSGKAPRAEVMDELVQDPECEIYVPRRSSVKRTISGRVYNFCSVECATRFEERNKTP
jgi:YHS domain-containing protein